MNGQEPAKPSTPARRNPWAWVPTLYFAQGIPYVVVMTVSVIMYKRLGISNTDIALYTSWLYLPWVIKPLWSPFVDMFRTKRFWVTSLQCLLGVSLALVAFVLPMPAFFQLTLAVFWLMALPPPHMISPRTASICLRWKNTSRPHLSASGARSTASR